jgi:hypothetical protein
MGQDHHASHAYRLIPERSFPEPLYSPNLLEGVFPTPCGETLGLLVEPHTVLLPRELDWKPQKLTSTFYPTFYPNPPQHHPTQTDTPRRGSSDNPHS